MFSRNFMRVFPVRKYADITGKANTVSSDIWLTNDKQIRLKKLTVYIAFGLLTLVCFSNFHTGDQILGPFKRPKSEIVYENSIPPEVLIPNKEIIEGFKTINKMRQLQKTIKHEE